MTEALFAGVSRRLINARVGSPKFGIRLFADPIQGYESDLTGTALVLANLQTKLAIIVLDICELFNPWRIKSGRGRQIFWAYLARTS